MAPGGVTPVDLMAISRILLLLAERRSFILLRHLEVPEQLLRAATSTRRWSPVTGTGQATHPFCFVLHRAGFVVPPYLRSGRWALTPPFHPCFLADLALRESAR